MALLAKSVDKQFAEEGGHWYCAKTGEARYEIKGTNGQMRPTTLRDARKLNLVPSVTTIAQIEAKPQLTRWLVEQGMLACLTLPRIAGETDQDFMARALDDSKKQTQEAARRGAYLHGLMENSMRTGRVQFNEHDDIGYIKPVFDWIHENFPGYDWSVERTIPPTGGFGGKIDLTGTHLTLPPVTIDYKCKDFDDPKKKLAYDEHCTQLATYSRALYLASLADCRRWTANGFPRCVNIFISSTVPGLFVTKEWTPQEIDNGYAAFEAMLTLWRIRKNFR